MRPSASRGSRRPHSRPPRVQVQTERRGAGGALSRLYRHPEPPPRTYPVLVVWMIARGRRLLSIAVCALAAHAVLYGSVSPGGAMHGYFGWYEMLVGGLTLGGVLAVGALVLAAALGHGRSRLRAVLPAPEERSALQVARLAQAALVFLFLQETLERSVSLGRAAVPSFAPSTWLLLLVSLVFFAALLVLAGRVGAGI